MPGAWNGQMGPQGGSWTPPPAGPSWGAHGWGGPPSLTPGGVPGPGTAVSGGVPPWLSTAPQAVQDWFNQNPQWLGTNTGGPSQLPGSPQATPWWRGPRPGMAGPTLSGRQPVPVGVGRNPTDRVLTTPNTGQVGTPVPMPGGSPGGLLGMLFDPAQHGNLAYAGMANAGNKGIDYTSASSRGLTDQILGQPIPTGGFGIGTGLTPSGLGTPVNARAARLAGQANQASQDAALQAGGSGGYQDAMWQEVAKALGR